MGTAASIPEVDEVNEAEARQVVEQDNEEWDEDKAKQFFVAAVAHAAVIGRKAKDRRTVSRAYFLQKANEKLLRMTQDELAAEASKVLHAAEERESKRQKAVTNYEHSFSGSAKDTKDEKEASELLRGECTRDKETNFYLIPREGTAQDLELLEAKGSWLRFLGSAGCYLYIHSLTHELRSTMPAAYIPPLENESFVSTEKQVGIPRIQLTDITAEIKKIVFEMKKTPLILDTSTDRKLATFYKYKGTLINATVFGACPGFNKDRPRLKPFLESVRAHIVQAMKAGSTCAIDLGLTDAPVFDSWCSKTGLRKDLFQEGGQSTRRNKFALTSIFRENEKEHGECIVRDDFLFFVITQFDQEAHAEKLNAAFGGALSELFYPVLLEW